MGDDAEIEGDLVEWNYGDYEGRTGDDIQRERPGWNVFVDGCPGGETPDEVADRVGRVVARIRNRGGRVVIFSHGHFSCALAVRWIGLPIAAGRRFTVDPAMIGVLGDKGGRPDTPVILRWNCPSDVQMIRS